MGSSGAVSSMRQLPRLPGWLGSTERPSASPQKRAAPSKSEVRQSISTAQRRERCISVPSDSFRSLHGEFRLPGASYRESYSLTSTMSRAGGLLSGGSQDRPISLVNCALRSRRPKHAVGLQGGKQAQQLRFPGFRNKQQRPARISPA